MEPELLGKVADSRTGARKVQNEPETSCVNRKEESAQKMMGTCQKDINPIF